MLVGATAKLAHVSVLNPGLVRHAIACVVQMIVLVMVSA
jgi:hypothetical protein